MYDYWCPWEDDISRPFLYTAQKTTFVFSISPSSIAAGKKTFVCRLKENIKAHVYRVLGAVKILYIYIIAGRLRSETHVLSVRHLWQRLHTIHGSTYRTVQQIFNLGSKKVFRRFPPFFKLSDKNKTTSLDPKLIVMTSKMILWAHVLESWEKKNFSSEIYSFSRNPSVKVSKRKRSRFCMKILLVEIKKFILLINFPKRC